MLGDRRLCLLLDIWNSTSVKPGLCNCSVGPSWVSPLLRSFSRGRILYSLKAFIVIECFHFKGLILDGWDFESVLTKSFDISQLPVTVLESCLW